MNESRKNETSSSSRDITKVSEISRSHQKSPTSASTIHHNWYCEVLFPRWTREKVVGKVEKKRDFLSKRNRARDRKLQFSQIGRAINYRSSKGPVVFRARPLDLTCAFTLFLPSYVSLCDLPGVDFVLPDILRIRPNSNDLGRC